MNADSECDVLVVGGGPVGLATACELLRHGVRCRIVEAKAEREVWSKAAAIQPRTLEIFRHMGIADRFIDAGRPIYGANLSANQKRLAHIDIDIPGTPYPFLLGLSQKRTEEILEAHLESLGGRLERGLELTAFGQNDAGVTATLKSATDGEQSLSVPWLIGCDGAHSTVRKTLGLAFDGTTFEETLIHADLRVDFGYQVDPHEVQLFASDHGALGFLPLFGDSRYRLIAMSPPEELSEPTLDNFQKLVELRAAGSKISLSDPEWMIDFHFHSRIVTKYRINRIFLAGDAAHIHSPVGAQGMNLGIQDAFNLAWKLALVQRGTARATLLDSYDLERRPIGEMIVNTTDMAAKRALRFLTLRNPIAVALRNQVMSLVIGSGLFTDRIFRGVGGLNIGYDDSPIVEQHHSSIWRAGLKKNLSTERPDLRAWKSFESAPGAGERVPEVELPESDSSLFDVICHGKHTLLLFDGEAETDDGYEILGAIARTVQGRYGDSVDVHVVLPHERTPESLKWTGSVIRDSDFTLHDHFGANSEALYLLRPDGYVAFRSQPAEPEKFEEYLATIFR